MRRTDDHGERCQRRRHFSTGMWLVVWLAFAGILTSPIIASANLLLMAAQTDDVPICHAPVVGDTTNNVPASPGHGKMAQCDLCLCCAPLLALEPSPPELAQPRLILLGAATLPPPSQAPPGERVTAAYPRGPPISL